MNKYQKALNFLDFYCEVRHVEEQELLQELVDKETSRKVSKNLFGRMACDNCGISFQELGQQSYCKHCGQKIDWNNEEEV